MPNVTRKSSPLDAVIPEACSNEAAGVAFLEAQRGWTADADATCPRFERRVGELTARDAENESLFRWLLGEEGEFPESLPRARYNFRSELRRRLAARATPEPSND